MTENEFYTFINKGDFKAVFNVWFNGTAFLLTDEKMQDAIRWLAEGLMSANNTHQHHWINFTVALAQMLSLSDGNKFALFLNHIFAHRHATKKLGLIISVLSHLLQNIQVNAQVIDHFIPTHHQGKFILISIITATESRIPYANEFLHQLINQCVARIQDFYKEIIAIAVRATNLNVEDITDYRTREMMRIICLLNTTRNPFEMDALLFHCNFPWIQDKSLRLTATEKQLTIQLRHLISNADETLKSVENLIAGNQKALDLLKHVSFRSPEEILAFTDMMRQFVHGFGKVNYLGGLLTCAQIASRKKHKYSFHAVALNGDNEFDAFLSLLKSTPAIYPIRLRFIVSGVHWVTGDIDIDATGSTRIILFDSIGLTHVRDDDYLVFEDTRRIIKLISTHFPDSTIYFPHEIRQNGALGCSIFAIDDITHLQRLEEHLGESLFDYFNKEGHQKSGYIIIDQTSIRITRACITMCQTPLSLLRTMQSESKLFGDMGIFKVRTAQEISRPINTNMETAEESIRKSMQPKPFSPQKAATSKSKSTMINTRLDRQLKMIALQNALFLLLNEPEFIMAAMQEFTLDTFKYRVHEHTAVLKRRLICS